MLRRSVSSGLIGLIFDLDDNGVRDLAADLNERAPPDRRIMVANDNRLIPGTLVPAETLRFYTPGQLHYLVACWLGETSIEDMAQTLGRDVAAIKRKARALGLLLRQRKVLRADFETLVARGAERLPAVMPIVPKGWPAPDAPLADPAVPAPAACPASGAVVDPGSISGSVGLPAPQVDQGRRKRVIMPWTGARTKSLCDLWLLGTRPVHIAAALGCSPLSVSTEAFRLCLPARVRDDDGRLVLKVKGYICYDQEHDEYFWSTRSSARQSAYRIARAARAMAA